MSEEVWGATWEEGHVTISVLTHKHRSYCLWSLSCSSDQSREVEGAEVETLEQAFEAIEQHVGCKLEFKRRSDDPIQRFIEDMEEFLPMSYMTAKLVERMKAKQAGTYKKQTWIAKWKRGRIEVSDSSFGGFVWDIFEDKDILDYGTAKTKEDAFKKCEEVVKQKLKFKLKP